MENEVDFDDLARQANESGGAMEVLNKLFGAAYALPKWLFIGRGELPNINPYIAARADYENGRQMIRAFTDTVRLARFSKENNLTNADGTTQFLEIPAHEIVDYLEQFIKYDVHGVWFNSDTESDGFSIPLKQLRPIKEHLAKLQASGGTLNETGFIPPSDSQKRTSLETVIIIINDGLMLPSGFVKNADYTCNLYSLVPTDWTGDAKLKENYLEKFLEKMYGATWRGGNSDGSRYVVDNSFSSVLKPEDTENINWAASVNSEKNHFWYYIAAENGEIATVTPTEFQKEFDAAKQSPAAPPAPTPQTSNLENWGLSESPDGEVDLKIRIFRTGNVKLGTQLVSFYTAIVLLLQDYKGSGEYEKIFNFAPEAMHNLKESFGSNTHGEYFRLRTFQYNPPNAVADATTIDSNQLHHIKTGATLKCSFALLQIQDNPTAAIYFGFEGNKGEVFRLLNAVAPALEAAGFVEDEPKK